MIQAKDLVNGQAGKNSSSWPQAPGAARTTASHHLCAELRAHMGRPRAILVVTAQRPATLQPRMEPEFLRVPRTVPCGEGCGGSYASLAWVISVLPWKASSPDHPDHALKLLQLIICSSYGFFLKVEFNKYFFLWR